MKKLIEYIKHSVSSKVSSLQTASVLTRVLAGVLTSKAIAVFIGPVGLALVGNLQNFVSSFQTIATLGLYKGMVKYIAKFKNHSIELSKTVSSIYYAGFFSTIFVSFFCYYNAEWINDIIFPTYNDYAYVIQVFAIVLPFYALNLFSFSIMNGFSKHKTLVIINIIGQILSVSIVLVLISQNRINGALISVAIAESLIFLITLVSVVNRRSLMPIIKLSNVSYGLLKRMSVYSLMALFSAVLLPLIALAIRSYLIEHIGFKDAGFWEAMSRISKYYLMVITSLMTVYFFPSLSKINKTSVFKKEVFSFYKAVIPILAIGLLIIYLLRRYIILFVFSEEFEPVESLFFWQLLGDFIKILSIVIAYQFLAKKMFWHYVLTEAFLVVILYITSVYFINMCGVEGAVIAHFVSYIMYFGIILLIFGSSLFGIDKLSK
ncbi:O-antigen translocase [uncultured Algibacter sp.]|uniref:O-antigen translocase n=1 Tax=uncultured Algibacter sp. TaxID=298659 RepID=UPI0032179F9D